MSRRDIPRSVASADGLAEADRAMVRDLVQTWQDKMQRNTLRSFYYNMHRAPRDLGISVPPQLRMLKQVIGWPAKAVDMLAARSQFDGFTSADDEVTASLQSLTDRNGLKRGYRKATLSELKHSCAFATVTRGDADEHQPAAIVRFYPATSAAALWSEEKNRIACGMVVVDRDMRPHHGEPTWVNVFTDDAVIMIRRQAEGWPWSAEYMPHSMGRCLMEPLAYDATLDRHFGKSRISRSVMDITDSAMRAAVRSEISSEFFTSPQKYLLGVDEDPFATKSRWDAYIGSIFAVTTNPKTGSTPQFGQLSQGSMQPHIDYIRSLAARFSGETNVPLSSLGVVSDNPSSAEAIYAAKEDMVIDAQNLNGDNGDALRNIALMALAIERNTDYWAVLDANLSVQAKFRNPAMPSVVSQSDAMVKMISALPWLADSDVALEEFGFSDDQIQRLRSTRARSVSRGIVERAMSGSSAQGGSE